MRANPLGWLVAILLGCGLGWAETAQGQSLAMHRFVGSESCGTSGCHGGGKGKDQAFLFAKKDIHRDALAVLGKAYAMRVAEAAGIAQPLTDTRCTVCHAPAQSVPASRFVKAEARDKVMGCETCHGAAESYLLFHTRTDVSHAQILSAGLRETKDLYHRANVCVACHLNIDPALLKAGHPVMYFDLASQQRKEPPHWAEPTGLEQEGRLWLTGQATALRELSWKAGQTSDADLVARVNSTRWLLRLTEGGKGALPEGADLRATQLAADRLARTATSSKWSKATFLAQLQRFAETNESFRDVGAGNSPEAQAAKTRELQWRAEVLVRAVEVFWAALKEQGTKSETMDQALAATVKVGKGAGNFSGPIFAAALQQVEVALVQMGQ